MKDIKIETKHGYSIKSHYIVKVEQKPTPIIQKIKNKIEDFFFDHFMWFYIPGMALAGYLFFHGLGVIK